MPSRPRNLFSENSKASILWISTAFYKPTLPSLILLLQAKTSRDNILKKILVFDNSFMTYVVKYKIEVTLYYLIVYLSC